MNDEIKDKIAAVYDTAQILDILGMEERDLVEALQEQILDNLYSFTEISPEEYDDE